MGRGKYQPEERTAYSPAHNATATQKGAAGEQRAADFLVQQGYTIVARNVRMRCGEIDIIAEKDQFLVFAEVKTMPNGTIRTLEHILGTQKQHKIIETAKRFLDTYRQYNDRFIRFDALVIDMPGFPPVYHIEDAFTELL